MQGPYPSRYDRRGLREGAALDILERPIEPNCDVYLPPKGERGKHWRPLKPLRGREVLAPIQALAQ
jgi:hypothetical protein